MWGASKATDRRDSFFQGRFILLSECDTLEARIEGNFNYTSLKNFTAKSQKSMITSLSRSNSFLLPK